MKHLLVLLWAVALGAGLTAIVSTYHRYRLQRLALLRHYLHYLLLANASVGATLVMTYLAANVRGWSRWIDREPALAVFVPSSFWLVAAFVYKLARVMFDLLGRDLPKRARLAFAWVVVAAPIVLLASQWLRHRELSREEVLGHSEILNVSLVAAGMVAMLAVMTGAGSLVHPGYRRAVRVFCGLHVGVYVLIPVAARLTYPTAWLALLASFLAMNLLPLVLLGGLVRQRRLSELGQLERCGSLKSFATRYGISEREQEIVRLLLAGSTNAEIGGALCISPHTVKNHVYSVYRKVGVRNRVELVNVIRDLSSAAAAGTEPDA